MLVVGSVNVDLVVATGRLPRPGETVTGGTFSRHSGGKGGNQAVAAARAGARVAFVGAVGADDLGAEATGALHEEGIEVAVERLSGPATGVAVIVVDAAGENQIAVAPGANADVDGTLVERALQTRDDLPEGVLLANLEVGDDAILAAARYAAERGMRIVVNPAPPRELPAELWGFRPLLVPNEGEARTLAGCTSRGDAARALYERARAPVVVTLGSDGVLVHADGGAVGYPAFEAQAVDTTGAGDTFCGVLAAALAEGHPLEPAVRRSAAAGAMSVTRPGARAGMPRRGEIDAFLEGRSP